MSTADDEFLAVADIARVLKLNQQTVRNWIDAGTLPALRLGRGVGVRRSDFDALVERGRTVLPVPPGESRTQAQAFWDGDLHPTPVIDRGD